jgi:hypothetical protein
MVVVVDLKEANLALEASAAALTDATDSRKLAILE